MALNLWITGCASLATRLFGHHLGLTCLSKWTFLWPLLLCTKSRCLPTQGLPTPHQSEHTPLPPSRLTFSSRKTGCTAAQATAHQVPAPSACPVSWSHCPVPCTLRSHLRTGGTLGTSPHESPCWGCQPLWSPLWRPFPEHTGSCPARRSYSPNRKCQQP